ncbi:MAG: TolC family protein [Acidobacteriaceae bacterium]
MKLKHMQAAACAVLVVMSGVQPGPMLVASAQQSGNAPATVQKPAGASAAPVATPQVPAGQQQAPAQQPPGQTPGSQVNPTAPAPQQSVQNDTTGAAGLPQAPQPKPTDPLYLRDSRVDYTDAHHFFPNPLNIYKATEYPQPRLSNTARLDNLLRDGKIYLSLSDAVTLALENNYDIAIARINLDIADTDILRAKAGSSLRGVSTGLVTGTQGGSSPTITGGGGPGGTASGAGGGGAGASGLVLSTNGGGPQPENLDPFLTGTLEYERATNQGTSVFQPSATSNTFTGNFAYQQGLVTGTELSVGFNNTRQSTTSTFPAFIPSLNTTLRATATQHVLQGCCVWINRRFIVQAKNDRRITDSAFRQQVIFTVTQVENIYWALVSAYEDTQAKTRALQQSTQLTADNRKQLEIGTLAPLDVVNSDSAVATDNQALIASKSNLEYQQLLMKQAIARNLNDPQLANAPVVPTDRVGLDRLPEEDMQVEDLVRQAYTNNPQIEQAALSMENNKITIRAEKNGLLPVLDVFGFYGTQALGGTPNPKAFGGAPPDPTVPGGFGGVLQNLFAANNPDYGVGATLNIPLRNRVAQADQARSQMEYRQTQMRLQQLYTQIRIGVINAQYALTNDRAQVQAAQAANDYAGQSLEAEQKKYRLGASTTANVLQQQRNLAGAANNLISATAAYARDRAALGQILSNTLDRYGISLQDAATGNVVTAPNVPGLTAPQAPAPPKPLTEKPAPLPQ